MAKGLDALPERMRNAEVERYLEILSHKRGYLVFKRAFDIVISAVMLLVLSPLLLVLALAVKIDSSGPVFYRQQRITKNLRKFRIFKFRSMVERADELGPLVTVGEDKRITRVGAFLRRSRLDELPQLINVLLGDMSFVGTRPEVEKYVDLYSSEMFATLLMPAGITSRASIAFKDEAALLEGSDDPDRVYVEEILPEKMIYNLEYIKKLSAREDLSVLFSTLFAVARDN